MLGKSQLKYIQSLGHKKQRDQDAVFIAEGPKIVAELLQEPGINVKQIFGLKEWIEQAPPSKVASTLITEVELARISQLQAPNQVLAIVEKMEAVQAVDASKELVLALDRIQDPGNLGTIIRIADWFGIRQLVCHPDCAELYNPKVVQSTMGSIARVRLLYTDLEQWLSSQQEIGIYAAALDGQDVKDLGRISKGVLVIGNESKGISPGVMALVKQRITIPRKGRAESLNAAVATGIILSQIT